MLEQYDYQLPQRLIASTPASPRDSSRLFIYDTTTDTVEFDTFLHLDRHVPPKSTLVFNDTKVVPARLWLTKESGGKIQVFLQMNELRPEDTLVKGIVDRKLTVGAKLYFRSGALLETVRQDEQFFFFKPSVERVQLWELLAKEGVTPIPPYIKRSPLSEPTLREKYQSVLAKHPASVAAPTASLHFTNRLLRKLDHSGVRRTEVTLHVGAGTFAPIDESNIRSKKLFTEYYMIGKTAAKIIDTAHRAHTPIIPVGTTALRTLESAASVRSSEALITPREDRTDIFIFPPYRFKVADALITNFHVPKSSLMLLVDAFLEHKGAKRRILDLYEIAIANNFRFYSFGDGMLIK
jgi:S-adenosylmethionine:tRNA ribosyltransferase-isomerase